MVKERRPNHPILIGRSANLPDILKMRQAEMIDQNEQNSQTTQDVELDAMIEARVIIFTIVMHPPSASALELARQCLSRRPGYPGRPWKRPRPRSTVQK